MVKSWESTYGVPEKPLKKTITERIEYYEKERVECYYKPNYQKKENKR